LFAPASAKSWDKGMGVLTTGVCPKAEKAVASTNAAVNKETTFIESSNLKCSSKHSPKHADKRVRSAKVECERGAN
jgi:hypothetical protein